jgi:hypothetical protein
MAHTGSTTLCDNLIFKPSLGSLTSHLNNAFDMTFSSIGILQTVRIRYTSVGIYTMQMHMASASDAPVILHLVTSLRTPESTGYLYSPICHHGIVLKTAHSNFSNCTFHYTQIKSKSKIHRRTGH